jgi:hypothetical protein
MTKKLQVFTAALAVVLYCGITLAQEPVVNVDQKLHPNIYAAQQHVAEANHEITVAQKDNRYDMKGHASKARQLLVQVNQELKAAAEDANAANAAMQKKK